MKNKTIFSSCCLLLLSGAANANDDYCAELISQINYQQARLYLDPPSVADGAVIINDKMKTNGGHEKYRQFASDWKARLQAKCELRSALRADKYYLNQIVTDDSSGADIVYVVHQDFGADSAAGPGNYAGVDRVLEGVPNRNVYVELTNFAEAGFSRTSVGHNMRGKTLNFQGSRLTVVGGNFDASIPVALTRVINNYKVTKEGKTLKVDMPMDATYSHIHGLNLQFTYDNSSYSDFTTWVTNSIEQSYADKITDVAFKLYLGTASQPNKTLLKTWNTGNNPTATMEFRLIRNTSKSCTGSWTLNQTYPSTGLSATQVGTLRTSDQCVLYWGDHTPDFSNNNCRVTTGADGRKTVWSPIDTGQCPTTATVYSAGGSIDAIFKIQR